MTSIFTLDEIATFDSVSCNDLSVSQNANMRCYVSQDIGYNNTQYGLSALSTNIINKDPAYYNNTAIGTFSLPVSLSQDNTAVGYNSLPMNANGNHNTALGSSSGLTNTAGNYNTYIGYGTDCTDNWYYSTAIGYNAKISADNQIKLGTASETVYCTNMIIAQDLTVRNITSTSGTLTIPTALLTTIKGNTTINYGTNHKCIFSSGSILSLKDNANNTFFSINKADATFSGNVSIGGNVYIGGSITGKLYQDLGNQNTQLGVSALDNIITNPNVLYCKNTAVGFNSLLVSLSHDNSAFGSNSLDGVITGNYNTGVGVSVGYTISAGSYNTFLGYGADAFDDYSYSTAIGYNALVNGDHQIQIGTDAETTYCTNMVNTNHTATTSTITNIKGLSSVVGNFSVSFGTNRKLSFQSDNYLVLYNLNTTVLSVNSTGFLYNGPSTLNGIVSINGATTISNNVSITGTLNLSGVLLVNNSLTAYGATSLGGTLTVSNLTTLNNGLTIANASATTINNPLVVNNVSTFANQTTINGPLITNSTLTGNIISSSSLTTKKINFSGSVGCYMFSFGATGNPYPLFCNTPNFANHSVDNADDAFLLLAGYKIVIYQGVGYTGSYQLYDNTTGTTAVYYTSTAPHTASSCALFFNNTALSITGIS